MLIKKLKRCAGLSIENVRNHIGGQMKQSCFYTEINRKGNVITF